MPAPHLHLMMNPQEYIISTLQSLAQPVPTSDDIGSISIEDAIFAKVMSKKFRKLRADDKAVTITKRAIHLAVQNSDPVTISYLFGGYKLWRFDEAPEIDWAELFSLMYFIRWMKSIASVYAPGARLDFYSEDIAIESLNNVPQAETDTYTKTFQSMITWLRPYLPQNVSITYRRYGNEYRYRAKYLIELEEAKKHILGENNGQLPQLSDAQRAATELNVKLLPDQADDPLWREKVEVTHRAMERTKSIAPYFEDATLIRACPSWYSGYIATGSTKKSAAKFWVGIGALERNGDSFSELVLSPKQLKTASFDWEPVNLQGLQGKNFSRIRVLK